MEDRAYQLEAVDALWRYFATHKGNPCVAMPTGTGKSVVIGKFIKSAFDNFPSYPHRIIKLTHVKELIEQNFAKLLELWPTAPAGVYSAGLKRREVADITYAGIASVWREPGQFGRVDLAIVDECHLVNAKEGTMYESFLGALREANPLLKVIGFSATCYRLGLGKITDGGLFTDFAYDITGREQFNKLINDGWLAPLIPKRTQAEIDVSKVRIQGGEFVQSELQAACNQDIVTYHALKEMVEQAHDRNSWLIFTAGIAHTERVAEMLNQEFGVTALPVHSKISDAERAAALQQFKAGGVRCLVNNNVLTTGFDHPYIDCIGVLRPTNSPVLWVQMLGRGTRPAPGKLNCQVLDFAANTRRLGPINDPVLPKKRGTSGRTGTAPIKICEACNTYNHASVAVCEACGHEFHREVRFGTHAGYQPLIAGNVEPPLIEEFKVDRVTYSIHKKKKAERPDSLKVSYFCGLRMFQEWLCFEHSGFPLHKAHAWFRQRSPSYFNGYIPDTTAQALQWASYLAVPSSIKVHVNREHPEITSYAF